MRGTRPGVGRSRKGTSRIWLASAAALFVGIIVGRSAHAEPLGSPPRLAVGAGLANDTRLAKADREFEAVALHALLAPMFASDRSGVYGSGSAGRHWQALLSEHIAKHLASSGRLRLTPARPTAQRRAPNVLPANPMQPASARDCGARECAPSTHWTTVVERARDGERVRPSGWEVRTIDAITNP